MTSVTESAEFFQTMLLSNGQGLNPGPLTNQELLGDPIGGATLEANVGCNQEWSAFDRGDETFRPWHVDHSRAMVAVFPVDAQSGSQSNLLPYAASPTELSVVWVHTNVPQIRPSGTEERVIIHGAQSHGKRTSMRRRVRPTCADCNRDFVRVQEFKRHLRDIHEPRRQCPFCDFTWTRPHKIKAHIIACHHGRFTAEQLIYFKTLYGQKIAAFLCVLM